MRFKSVVAFISLAVALGVLAYLFLSVKKEIPAISHAGKSLSQTDTKNHDINLEENSPDEISHNEKAPHNEENRNNALSQNLDAQEVINYPVIEHHFEIPFEEKKGNIQSLSLRI